MYNDTFDEILKVDQLDSPVKEYCNDRMDALYQTIRKLSREKMSVCMIHRLLHIIFETEETSILKDQEEEVYDIILEKFKFCNDLAQSTKLSIQELLLLAPKKVLSNLTLLFMKSREVMYLIDHFLEIDFFIQEILPRSWFELLLAEKITF